VLTARSAAAGGEPLTLLKTIASSRGGSVLGATLGATRMNNLEMLRTRVGNRGNESEVTD
jgi:hypothetical protein